MNKRRTLSGVYYWLLVNYFILRYCIISLLLRIFYSLLPS